MTVSSKNRRSIEIDGQRYLWWVTDDDDFPFVPGPALTVVSDDRRFFVRYHLKQPDAFRHVTVLGPLFRDVPGRRRFRSPPFGTEVTISPRDVAGLVRWCLTGTDPIVMVDYRGCTMP